ncbi:hypothetical protein O185_21620 [Photorhabdus temperata J3]|uniref:Toxin n=2 Tax=Photorhabdus temperata TaxID=574560 RepID=U7QST5_PHOTE|nr:hypothetical protein O185_21620 [Photorhabdus temperata J3]
MGQTLSSAGSFGMTEMSVPLPISSGRGYAPMLALHYSSGGENGLFGHGWGLGIMRVTRSVRHGVPRYNQQDVFLGPDGEELVAERESNGRIHTVSCSEYAGFPLDNTYTVTRYFPKVESAFNRLEYWQCKDNAGFWLLHGANGELHCLGKEPQARLADHDNPQHVAEWWLQESLSPSGHQIRYCYRDDCQTAALERVYYGNKQASNALLAWDDCALEAKDWLFTLLFDYGERGCDLNKVPDWQVAHSTAPTRKDPQHRYEYGFPRDIKLLCRQVLMFHTFAELNDGKPCLVRRMLFDYDENPLMTQLVGIQSAGYDERKALLSVPPLDFHYTPFSHSAEGQLWQPLEALSEIKDGQDYQLVDLYGEGLPGLLYHDPDGWYYRAPERGKTPDSVIYGTLHELPASPSFTGSKMTLMDITGDGRLDWIVQRPGMAGYFTLNAAKQWSGFIPFNAWPSEFQAATAQLMDLTGAGLQDLVLIGPKSVRLYENKRQGFGGPVTISQTEDVMLPVVGRDVTELVAFSDVLGSGQQHLISIRHDAVTCWPNLGRGKFGKPIRLPGLTLDERTFNPSQVYLADIDGSGAVDIIYAEASQLRIFRNQSGQGFLEDRVLPLPEGVCYDRLCRLSCVDLYGTGVTSLVLTVPYMAIRHWCYTFADKKPYLLEGMNNNMGADTQFHYSNSAQSWLDEKQAFPQAVCHLPFPVQLLTRVQTLDEITGNCLTQTCRYRRGMYDGTARKFRGFGWVEVQDTDENARATGIHESASSPTLTRTWYHTGREEDESSLSEMPGKLWRPYRLNSTRLTEWNGSADQLIDPDNVLKQPLYRSLQGHVLCQEIYGLDKSSIESVPYSVTFYRYQLRVVQPAFGAIEPVVFPALLETLSYVYERIASDPKITQSVQLEFDAFGSVLHGVDIAYPRRQFKELKVYASSLPEGTFAATEDSQQYVLWLNEHRAKMYHLCDAQDWRLGLPNMARENTLQYKVQDVPEGGLSLEKLKAPGGLLGKDRARIFTGQTQWKYKDDNPTLSALLEYTETAELDDISLNAFNGVLDGQAIKDKLLAAGYIEAPKILGAKEESDPVWVARRGFTTWSDYSCFYLPVATRSSLLVGHTTIKWDKHCCAVIEIKDAAGHTTVAEYDYRFLIPWKIIDINDNASEVSIDALGRVLATTFYGTENGKAVGFMKDIKAFSPPHTSMGATLDNPNVPQHVASYVLVDTHSWMGKLEGVNARDHASLLSQHFVTSEGYVRSLARQRLASGSSESSIASLLSGKISAVQRLPISNAVFIADNYPNVEQQIRTRVTFYDGFSRTLQTAQRHKSGKAAIRDPDGRLKVTDNGKAVVPVLADTTTRWAVSGRMEYNNKGLSVRMYQPFFVNDWRYIADDSLRVNGYADCHFYDALGREISVTTAKGYIRRQRHYPWFSVAEDENDTYAELVGQIVH